MHWGRQEDAHEFLRYVIDHMQKACLNGHTKWVHYNAALAIFAIQLQTVPVCM